MTNANTAPLREQMLAQSRRIALLQRRNRDLRRAIADSLDMIAEAMSQPYPHDLMREARDVLADAQPQSDVRI